MTDTPLPGATGPEAGRSGIAAARLSRWSATGNRPAVWRPEALTSTIGLASVQAAALLSPQKGWVVPFWDDDVVTHTGEAALVALFCGIYLLGKIMALPQVRALSYITAAILCAFWGVWWTLKIVRVEIANTQYFLTLALFLPTLLGVAVMARRYGRPVFAVIPGYTPLVSGPVKDVRLRHLASPNETVDGCHGLVVDMRCALAPEWERFVARAALNGLQVVDVAQFNELTRGRADIEDHSGRAFVAALPALVYPQVKRALDLAGVALLCVPVLLVVGACAVAIKLDSRGPVFFRQERAGYRGRTFRVWKLRSMEHRVAPTGQAAASSSAFGPAFTRADDPRVTGVGRMLRQYRLDELPQIFNVLTGEMSWIGPRPEALELAQWYEREIPFYVYRHVVRPGITGWAQVLQGNVAEIDAARVKLEYDFFYIKHLSFWLDIVIVVKTIRTVLTGFGAR